jgi:hypothetical protein
MPSLLAKERFATQLKLDLNRFNSELPRELRRSRAFPVASTRHLPNQWAKVQAVGELRARERRPLQTVADPLGVGLEGPYSGRKGRRQLGGLSGPPG